jgi:hypothetical protein
VLLVEIAANDRTHDRTSSNEPPTGHQAFDSDGNDPCDGARRGPVHKGTSIAAKNAGMTRSRPYFVGSVMKLPTK